ncbi:MAG: hypothetical protein U1D29_17920 [Burkholderiales bacterium]|nr:hypothetical protein [Burkholderiales bacterium]
MTIQTIDTAMAKRMVEAAAIRGASIIGQPGGWAVMLKLGLQERPLGVQRGNKPRMWRSLDTCMEYLKKELHIARIDSLDATHHTDAALPSVARPDSAKRMREAFEASAYTQWLHEVVEDSRAGLADGTYQRIESDEWERVRADKLRQRADMAK